MNRRCYIVRVIFKPCSLLKSDYRCLFCKAKLETFSQIANNFITLLGKSNNIFLLNRLWPWLNCIIYIEYADKDILTSKKAIY